MPATCTAPITNRRKRVSIAPPAGYVRWWRVDRNVYSDAGTTPITADGSIYQINDQAGGSHLVQSTSGDRPVYKTSIINGLPVARGDGSDDYMTASLDGSAYTAFGIGLIIRPTADGSGNGRGILSWADAAQSGTPLVLIQRHGTNVRVYVNGSYRYTIAHANNTTKAYALTWDGTTYKLWVDGVQQSDYTGGQLYKSTALTIYFMSGYQGTVQGDMPEAIIYNSAVSGSLLSTYLKARAGIP